MSDICKDIKFSAEFDYLTKKGQTSKGSIELTVCLTPALNDLQPASSHSIRISQENKTNQVSIAGYGLSAVFHEALKIADPSEDFCEKAKAVVGTIQRDQIFYELNLSRS